MYHPIRAPRLSERIEEHIWSLISSGQLKPGDKIPSARELSQQFKVSLVTVREALKGLEAFGVVEMMRGRDGGGVIRAVKDGSVKAMIYNLMNSQDVGYEELREVRSFLEPSTIRLAMRKISGSLIAQLEQNVEYCEAKLKNAGPFLSDSDFNGLKEHELQFHRLIAMATGNPVLIFMVDYIMDFPLHPAEEKNPEIRRKVSLELTENHRLLLGLIKKGDVEGAARLMEEHVQGYSGR
jgi:GntR family transcriptional repressor for pyruvate dehydrogenase complex